MAGLNVAGGFKSLGEGLKSLQEILGQQETEKKAGAQQTLLNQLMVNRDTRDQEQFQFLKDQAIQQDEEAFRANDRKIDAENMQKEYDAYTRRAEMESTSLANQLKQAQIAKTIAETGQVGKAKLTKEERTKKATTDAGLKYPPSVISPTQRQEIIGRTGRLPTQPETAGFTSQPDIMTLFQQLQNQITPEDAQRKFGFTLSPEVEQSRKSPRARVGMKKDGGEVQVLQSELEELLEELQGL